MNEDQVDRVVDLIGDGPESIRGLRRLAVGLAVVGKLGGEDNDADFHALVAALRRPPGGKVDQWCVAIDDLPASLGRPERFVRLGTLARIEKGRTGIQAAIPGPYPLVVTAEHRQSCDHFDFDGAAAIVPLVSSAGHGKASLQRLHYQEGQFALGTILAAVFPKDPHHLSARFLFEYLSAFKDDLLVSRMIGTANVTLTMGKLSDVPVPLIAAPVQARVDEIMGLCDRLEAARCAREETRDRLAAASLARLNAPDVENFQADARFALDALPALTTRPDQIKQLRRTILNLAVRGKLVPQDASDEPASELLKRIASEKSKLVGAGNARRDDAGSLGPSDQNDFPIPDSWALVPTTFPTRSLSDLGKKVQTKDVLASGRFPVVDQGKVIIRGYCDDPEKVIRVDTPIIVFGDHTRETKIIDFDFVVGADGVKLLRPICIDASYYFLALQWLPLDSRGYGRHFKLLKASKIPLPPLAEQHRIVAKVDELMGLCDRLEASLATASTTRLRLLDALLREALDPVPLDEAA